MPMIVRPAKKKTLSFKKVRDGDGTPPSMLMVHLKRFNLDG